MPADTSGLQAGKNLYTFGPTRFVIAQKMLLLCILHSAFCILHFVRQHDKLKFETQRMHNGRIRLDAPVVF